MTATWAAKRGRILAASLGVLGAWSCTVADKGEYTFTDNPGAGGSSSAGKGTGGTSTAGKGGTSGEAGVSETGGTSGLGGRGGRGGRGSLLGGRGGKAGTGGEAGQSGTAGVSGTGGNAGAAGESGAGGEAGGTGQCGDGSVDAGEQCDFGSNNGVTACAYGLKSCTVCTATCSRASGTVAYCGDGKIQASHEQCDDGNTVNETCRYGDSSCTGCDSTCHKLVNYCGDKLVNGPKLTSVKLEYQGHWSLCSTTSAGLTMPFALNGVPFPSAPQGACTCNSPQNPVSLVTTDSTILKAVRPNGNVLELLGVNDTDYTLVPWVRLTLSFDAISDIVVTPFDPHAVAGGTDPCYLNGNSANVIDTEGYLAGGFDGVPVEMCDGTAGCNGCATRLPTTCADILRANSAAVDGPYRIDPTGGDSTDAITAYCDMTDGGISYEALAFGQSGVSYDGYAQVEDAELQNAQAQQALLWLYDMQAGIINLNPGWASNNCAYRTTSSWIQAGTNYLIPADYEQTSGYHCGGATTPYTESLMKLSLYNTQAVQTPPVPLNLFTTYPITLQTGADPTTISPGFFFKKQ